MTKDLMVRICESLTLLLKQHDLVYYEDCGPLGEGWQSDELVKLWTEIKLLQHDLSHLIENNCNFSC